MTANQIAGLVVTIVVFSLLSVPLFIELKAYWNRRTKKEEPLPRIDMLDEKVNTYIHSTDWKSRRAEKRGDWDIQRTEWDMEWAKIEGVFPTPTGYTWEQMQAMERLFRHLPPDQFYRLMNTKGLRQ